ncbi:jg24032 [Pararge aegeria aegeria]|uniref:Jg24032 protein n=1 Tax=Pararge aegeria aegeria TaxID=348720 RepID=A0A8S4RAL6_9NEOP|nr:jg24032 [Pararge aegeria aegeria]
MRAHTVKKSRHPEVLIVVVWMIVAPARAMFHYPTREDNMLVCDSYVDASYMIAFFYPIVLIVVCTVYAVLTRKIPEAFNESKHIGFTMYTTCVIWLAFVPLYFGTASHVPLRITSMAVTISLSASVTLVCLFSPKNQAEVRRHQAITAFQRSALYCCQIRVVGSLLPQSPTVLLQLYIILVRPERNVRQSIMPVRYSRKPPAALAIPHPPNKKPPCADKETQTDPVEFNKLTNGQTVQAKNGVNVKDEKKDTSDKVKDKHEKNDSEGVKCNSVKINREDKKVRSTNEKREGL